MKYQPKLGEHLYLQSHCGYYYIDLIKTPYTVIKVCSPNKILVQEAMPLFNAPRYFDSMPYDIIECHSGKIIELRYSAKKDAWQYSDSYNKDIAHFGKWEYFPYLD